MAGLNEPVFGAATTGISSSGYYNISPTTGQNYMITNIYRGKKATLYRHDGTNNIEVDITTGAGAWCSYKFFISTGNYLRVKNTSTGTAYFAYDGVRVL